MTQFHGLTAKGPYFEGWYFKHQAGDHTLALIPGVQYDKAGHRTAFIQVLTEGGSYRIFYPMSAFKVCPHCLSVNIGGNRFTHNGLSVDLQTRGLRLKGKIRYGPLTPPKSDVMGPFSHMPRMQCRHGVISLGHALEGEIEQNGKTVSFDNGIGYIEKDWGSSFPERYAWAQCNDFSGQKSAVMLSVADVPFLGRQFIGCIAVVLHGGREYRLATYRGVQIERCDSKGVVLRQGRYRLRADFQPPAGHPLLAPRQGVMDRIIRETSDCRAAFSFFERDDAVFRLKSNHTCFEYCAPKAIV